MVAKFMLDPEQYGHWKVKMKASLQSVDMDVWASVEDGYEVPKTIDKDAVVVNEPLAKWTKREKEMSRYNAKALCGIFTSVKKKQVDLIQGCKNAKEAWDIVQLHFEDKFSFHEVVGMLKAHEMELDGVGNHTEVNLTISEKTSKKSENEDEMVKMICVLHQVLREVIQWQGHEKVDVSKQRQEAGEPCGYKDVQCYKCRGYGHFKRECPMAKRRRFKGF
ncbi:hypothetical protein DY000_02022616 [Brassica cretica]|uniref:CCHC-type domain-containing protein n=1 Tax=Brassica cretica TaxID=69181 RepID=A0ABQ7E6U0_BRACR|nr:hypothetical protein DY000_02022616 [Brassica cretica]